MPSAEIQAAGPVSPPPSATRPSPTATIRPSVSRVRPLVSSDRQPPLPSGRSMPMAPLGSPTKTTTSPPSTTGLPMIAPSASPGSGTGSSQAVPSALRADQAGPGPTPKAMKPVPSAATPCGSRPSNGLDRSVQVRPSSDDQANATSPAPVPRITAWSPAAAAWAIPPAHRIGSNGAAFQPPAASRIQIEVTDGCAQSPSPSPRVRTRSPQAIDRPIDARRPGQRLARPGRAAIARCPGDPATRRAAPPTPTATTVSGSATTSAIAPTPAASGSSTSVQARSGARRGGAAVAGGASLGEATATGVGAAEAAAVGVGASGRLRRPAARQGQTDDERQRGIRRVGAGREGGTCPWDAGRAGVRDERRNASESLSAVASAGPRRSRARRSGRSDR